MTNKILFGVIGVLLASAASVGVAVAQEKLFHPSEEGDRQVLSDSVEGGVSDDSPNLNDDSSDDVGSMQVSVSKSKSDDDDEWDDESEDEDEDSDDDDDDDSRSSRASSAPVSSGQSASASPAVSAPAASAKTYTMAEVSSHNSRTNCYTVVNGSVYDVTGFISQHPGGAPAVLSLCGIDGSSAFIDQHSGQRRPANELASFKIGTLVN